ncbi:hypothetical protein BU14_1598s0002 [Porphyra umbilicalis]|uniref:Uncharacterized protein n=1 Tax=Porphyra umbilicalis TaxID=2786 RepID=A0A1X6NL66_PORUM|nr:hypothetical protein BU14_1598s0002 [Porphyra umbilicalis]|eukprot:OSX69354.1 hypothetical protein BU14_1598s0002 [Porphyra umbilicalis]
MSRRVGDKRATAEPTRYRIVADVASRLSPWQVGPQERASEHVKHAMVATWSARARWHSRKGASTKKQDRTCMNRARSPTPTQNADEKKFRT